MVSNRFLEMNGVYNPPKPIAQAPIPKTPTHKTTRFLEINGVQNTTPKPVQSPPPKPMVYQTTRFLEMNGVVPPLQNLANQVGSPGHPTAVPNPQPSTPRPIPTPEAIIRADARIASEISAGRDADRLHLINPRTGWEYTDREISEISERLDRQNEQNQIAAKTAQSSDAGIAELESNLEFLEGKRQKILDLPPPGGGHAGANKKRRRTQELERVDQQQASIEADIAALQDGHKVENEAATGRTSDEATLDIITFLEARKEELESEPSRGGHGGRIAGERRAEEIAKIDADLTRIEVGQRPLLDYVDSETSLQFHADAAEIDRALLDITIEHEGGNFHSMWFSPVWPTLQELMNDMPDIWKGGDIDTSVGYGQVQPRNAVEIGEDTFGLDLSHEDARERLTGNNEFSNAIIAEFLSRRADMIDPEHRSNRVVFTSHAASPETIEKFNKIDWDFTRAEALVEAGELKESTFNALKDRYFTHYPNALD